MWKNLQVLSVFMPHQHTATRQTGVSPKKSFFLGIASQTHYRQFWVVFEPPAEKKQTNMV